MTQYQIDDVTQLYYYAQKDTGAPTEDPNNVFFDPLGVNWNLENAKTELKFKDNVWKTVEFPAPGALQRPHIAMLFKHQLPITPTKISFAFQGYAIRASNYEVRFYIWNFTLSQWDRIGTGFIKAGSDTDWTDSITSGFADYISGGVFYAIAYTYEGPGTSGLGLYADYWSIDALIPSAVGSSFYMGV